MPKCIGVLGASSFVGRRLLQGLVRQGFEVVAISRTPPDTSGNGVTWYLSRDKRIPEMDAVISVAPIWVMQTYFDLFSAKGVKSVVALSSTSRFTKADSPIASERDVAQNLAAAEKTLQQWADSNGVQWTVLRPTLIYGDGKDKNITQIARFCRRFGFFPMMGKGTGLRQPIHCADVAEASLACLDNPRAAGRSYTIAGAEQLTYFKMIERVFDALGRRVMVVPIPSVVCRIALHLLRVLPRYRHLTIAMFERMDQDMAFDIEDARQELGFSPKPFAPTKADCGF